uniref:Uncharacterized protein n=1 Tax=Octopus bimaculoides TaxID=37653 RepID=A0A0L8HMW9_OCTBM
MLSKGIYQYQLRLYYTLLWLLRIVYTGSTLDVNKWDVEYKTVRTKLLFSSLIHKLLYADDCNHVAPCSICAKCVWTEIAGYG